MFTSFGGEINKNKNTIGLANCNLVNGESSRRLVFLGSSQRHSEEEWPLPYHTNPRLRWACDLYGHIPAQPSKLAGQPKFSSSGSTGHRTSTRALWDPTCWLYISMHAREVCKKNVGLFLEISNTWLKSKHKVLLHCAPCFWVKNMFHRSGVGSSYGNVGSTSIFCWWQKK